MKKIIILSFLLNFVITACNSGKTTEETKVKDSVENVEVKSVETIIQNEDSLMEAKKMELGIE
jgi:hypothetical protein